MSSYTTCDNDRLDLIAWHYYGFVSGSVEAILEANPFLAHEGSLLPAGLTLVLPDLTPPPVKTRLRLWD